VRCGVDQDLHTHLCHVVNGDGREPLVAEGQAQFTVSQRAHTKLPEAIGLMFSWLQPTLETLSVQANS
jgi:hypothetical protein